MRRNSMREADYRFDYLDDIDLDTIELDYRDDPCVVSLCQNLRTERRSHAIEIELMEEKIEDLKWDSVGG